MLWLAESDDILNENSSCHPDSPYGRSKLQAEQALIELAKDSNMTWTILRPTLVYGPGNRANMEPPDETN
jgi:nucleoside-diphosphate-sugar epimerase